MSNENLHPRLVLTSKPRATLHKFATIPGEANNGTTIEKYTTRFGTTFEKHIQANGVTTWWRLVKADI